MDRPAPRLRSLTVGDDPAAWEAAGFRVDGGVVELGTVAVVLTGPSGGRGLRSWSLTDLPEGTDEVDGLPTAPALHEGPPAATTHPNGATAVDHVVVLSPDCGRTAAALEALGLALRRERSTTSHGSPVRQLFFRVGEPVLEVVGPEGEPDPAAVAQPARFFGLAVTTADGAAALLGDGLGRPTEAVQPGRRIATVRHRQLGLSVALALMSPDPR